MNFLKALSLATAYFFLTSLVSCGILTAHYARLFPHDGQDGLAGALGGIKIALYSAPVVLVIAWGILTVRSLERDRRASLRKG